MGERRRCSFRVHFQAVGSTENLLTGSIMQDALVQCPGWRFPVLTNLICATTTLLPSIKKPPLVPLKERAHNDSDLFSLCCFEVKETSSNSRVRFCEGREQRDAGNI